MSDISTGLWDCFSVNLPEENALVKIETETETEQCYQESTPKALFPSFTLW